MSKLTQYDPMQLRGMVEDTYGEWVNIEELKEVLGDIFIEGETYDSIESKIRELIGGLR